MRDVESRARRELLSQIKSTKTLRKLAKIIQVSGCPFQFCDDDEFQCSLYGVLGVTQVLSLCPKIIGYLYKIYSFLVPSFSVFHLYQLLYRQPLAIEQSDSTFNKKMNQIKVLLNGDVSFSV